MNFEELSSMRHPNRLRVRGDHKRTPADLAKERSERYHSGRAAANPGPHRKWMQNFSLHTGRPLWLILKES